uniref:Cadherin N-terminal domain-containing protein n=1 Tax=Oryzias sinensis TaxID=183150 RepID=A0A8C7XSX4_9TELE
LGVGVLEKKNAALLSLRFTCLWSVSAAQIRYSIAEEVKEGTAVGNTAKDLGLEKNSLKVRKYRIGSGGTDSLFHV